MREVVEVASRLVLLVVAVAFVILVWYVPVKALIQMILVWMIMKPLITDENMWRPSDRGEPR